MQRCLFVAFCLFAAQGAHAQAAADNTTSIEDLLKAATTAFNNGDYKTAATGLNSIITQAQNKTKLEPLYYMLGASQYNNNNFDDAATTFNSYITQYPTGEHMNDVLMALARCDINLKKQSDALPLLKKLEDKPLYRDRVLVMEADIAKSIDNPTLAISSLETLIAPGLNSATAINGAVTLAELYLSSGDTKKAADLFTQLQKNVSKVNSVASLNKIAISLGDAYLNAGDYDNAIKSYRTIRSKEQVLDLVNRRIESYTKQLQDNRDAAKGNAAVAMSMAAENSEIQSLIEFNKGLLDTYGKTPDYTGQIWIRLGQAYYKQQRKWEALVVYNELLDSLPEAKERETALLGKIIALADLQLITDALANCAEFIKTYPQSTQLPLVVYLQGGLAFQNKDYATAEINLKKGIPLETQESFRNDMQYLLASSQFALGKYDLAILSYVDYQKNFPTGKHLEESWYRIALATLLNGYLKKADLAFQDYLKKYPTGHFAADCAYRSAYCLFADSTPQSPRYDEVIAACKKWFETYPGNIEIAEVQALMADAYMSQNKPVDALPLYMKSIQNATTDQLLHYSLKAANKILEKNQDWVTIAKMWKDVVDRHDDTPMVLEGVLAISKATAHEGKIAEAKAYIMEKIKPHVEDPASEGVEPLLTQLAKMCAKGNRLVIIAPKVAPSATTPPGAAPSATPGSTASTAPATAAAVPVAAPETPPPTPAMQEQAAEADLESYIRPLETLTAPTSRARFFYAKAQFYLMRRDTDNYQSCLKQIADIFKPEDLSPALLGAAGDYCLAQKRWDDAQLFYKALVVDYPKSEFTDTGYIGLGSIALGKNDYKTALANYNDALDKVASDFKIKDALVGKAQALLGLDQLDEAKSLFEQVAGNRAWRDAAALCVLSLGDIEQRRNRLPEANNYYQRVYVAYQRYTPLVAKAYLRSGEIFEKLGKKPEAINTYQEMIKNPRLAAFPETQEAKDHLKALGVEGV